MVEAAIARGQPIPEWVENEPLLFPGEQFYLDAFWELSTCRAIGWNIGPIPWTALVEYATFAGLDLELFLVFVPVIRALDTEYLKWVDKKQPKPGKGNKRGK